MKFRNVTLLLTFTALLGGCETFQQTNYEMQKQFGLYPVDPPRAETPMPPPGTISQANWAAQRAETMRATNQGYTPPVGYKEPEQPAAQQQNGQPQPAAAAPAAARSPAAAPARSASAPVRPATPAPSTVPNPAAMTPLSPVSSGAAALPAGYTPSASVVDRPDDAAAQQKLAAATGAQPTPPALAGSMTAAAVSTSVTPAPGWKAHLASHRTESAAINEWQELLKTNAALYGQFDPLVEWIDTQRGPFARLLLVGFADRKAADDACAKVRSSTRYCASVQ